MQKQKHYKRLRQFSNLLMLSFWISCLICGCDGKKEQAVIDPREIEQNKLLQYFVAANPGKTVILYAQEDLNNDGQKDLLVL